MLQERAELGAVHPLHMPLSVHPRLVLILPFEGAHTDYTHKRISLFDREMLIYPSIYLFMYVCMYVNLFVFKYLQFLIILSGYFSGHVNFTSNETLI